MFSRIVEDRKVTGNFVDITGFDQGDYFWNVTATDEEKRDSAPSDTFKFTLVTQGKGQEMLLEVEAPNCTATWWSSSGAPNRAPR